MELVEPHKVPHRPPATWVLPAKQEGSEAGRSPPPSVRDTLPLTPGICGAWVVAAPSLLSLTLMLWLLLC